MHSSFQFRMNRRAWLVVLAVGLAGWTGRGAPLTNDNDRALCVMTYNLRFASTNPPNAWPERRPLMRELLRQVAPDLLGTQEGLYGQLKDLAADLPGYEWIGLGRDGGSRGEFMAIFFRTNRLEPLAFDHFWLSDTPRLMGSSSWGNRLNRMVTWVQFRDRRTGAMFYCFNTHLDHQSQESREKSAELLRREIAALPSPGPVLLLGDFNAVAGQNRAYEILTGDGFFADAWLRARTRQGEGLGTFNGFKQVPTDGRRIDWVLVRGGVEVQRAAILPFQRNGQFPSDHFPVVAWVRLTGGH